MEQTQKILMRQFVGIVALVVLLVILYEADLMESGAGIGRSPNGEFMVTSVMELLTLGCAFLSLRLFKFGAVHADLVSRKALALRKWGVVRLSLIEIPMILDTLLYYIYMNPTFGYLAIILALCLPFVWPSMTRCMAETTEDEA